MCEPSELTGESCVPGCTLPRGHNSRHRGTDSKRPAGFTPGAQPREDHHPVPLPIHQYAAVVVRWVDGDTVDLDVDLGFHMTLRARCRVNGVDTPERGQAGWAEATAFARAYAPEGSDVLIYTDLPRDKYGRMLAEIITPAGNLSHAIIEAGVGRAYDGGAR